GEGGLKLGLACSGTVSRSNSSREVQPRARARSPRRARKRQPSSAPYQRLLQPTSPPRGEAPLASPSGFVPKLLFPRGWYRYGSAETRAPPAFLAARLEAPVPPRGWYGRMVRSGCFMVFGRWFDPDRFFFPFVSQFPVVTVLLDEASLLEGLLGAHHPHVIRVAGFCEPT